MIDYQPTDEYLINSIKGGDIEKTAILFDRHHKNIFSYFYRLTKSRIESEDLTQNVFVRLIRFRNSYKPDRHFLPWIFRIAHHVFIDHCNYKTKEINQLNNYHQAISDELENDNNDDKLTVFYKAFEKLPVDYRELIIMNRYHELTYKQIGESLGMNEKAVKQKAFRALEKLRAECKKLVEVDV
jgi:RNA polymerase sigma factor (sigma-70 family)